MVDPMDMDKLAKVNAENQAAQAVSKSRGGSIGKAAGGGVGAISAGMAYLDGSGSYSLEHPELNPATKEWAARGAGLTEVGAAGAGAFFGQMFLGRFGPVVRLLGALGGGYGAAVSSKKYGLTEAGGNHAGAWHDENTGAYSNKFDGSSQLPEGVTLETALKNPKLKPAVDELANAVRAYENNVPVLVLKDRNGDGQMEEYKITPKVGDRTFLNLPDYVRATVGKGEHNLPYDTANLVDALAQTQVISEVQQVVANQRR